MCFMLSTGDSARDKDKKNLQACDSVHAELQVVLSPLTAQHSVSFSEKCSFNQQTGFPEDKP